MILKLADADLLLTDKQEQSVYDVASPACHYFLSHKSKLNLSLKKNFSTSPLTVSWFSTFFSTLH